MAGNENPFGFGSGEFDDIAREARDMLGRIVGGATGGRDVFSGLFDEAGRRTRREPETAGEAGDGVWAIIATADDGAARVEQVFKTEIEALRAHQHNTDATRKVRFLPYGIAVTALED
ncbi:MULTISPECIES: hypothetical protein [Tsukamurella]|uniref:Uncharacterized protein n=1 Tax=Tsukamurella strandjordii TaxID=147577 RepID=A0AA90ND85_9ACTN|nr:MULTISPECIES: hypothetical protein [Tsukamurella]MDP0400367.1 hypothetical protein [Tsukamurella strandjordii]GIZ98392.1 hypothetical protein TTY48_30040 [Tsukamurella sp. TY48]